MLKILNASPGFVAPLTEQEIKDFLTMQVPQWSHSVPRSQEVKTAHGLRLPFFNHA